MSKVSDRTTGKLTDIGLQPDRSLAKDCADFYVLERLLANGNHKASLPLARLEHELGKEYSTYLDMAVGGEARHIGVLLSEGRLPTRPRHLTGYLRACEAVDWDRTRSWFIWLQERRAHPDATLPWLLSIAEIFVSPSWPRSDEMNGAESGEPIYATGGPAWSTAARLTHSYLCDTISDRVFLNMAFSLQHNKSVIFNKVYHVTELKRALELQANDQYESLSRLCSRPVLSLWEDNVWEAKNREQRQLSYLEG